MNAFEQYRDMYRKVYGREITREWWDNACKKQEPQRKLTDDEFDYDQYSQEQGDGPIY